MIPIFHDYSLEPKITKCGDLLYLVSNFYALNYRFQNWKKSIVNLKKAIFWFTWKVHLAKSKSLEENNQAKVWEKVLPIIEKYFLFIFEKSWESKERTEMFWAFRFQKHM